MTSNSIHTTDSPSFYYRRSGSGPAIVLLHGFPATGTLWDDVAGILSARFTVLVPDLPGTGSSRLEGEAITLEGIAACIQAMLKDAGFETAIIVGHSMGGYVALAFAKKYRESVAGIALVHSTAAADDDAKRELRRKTIELIRKGGKDGFVRSFIPSLFGPEFKTNNPSRIEAQVTESASMADATMIAFYTAMMERKDSLELITNAGLPLQWIFGSEDNIIPAGKVMQQTYLSDVNFISMYSGVGHMSMIESPVRLASDLEDFGVYCYKRLEAAQHL